MNDDQRIALLESVYNHISIHCPTLREALMLLRILREAGLFWNSGASLAHISNWYEYMNHTTYQLSDGGIVFGTIEDDKKCGNDVVEFSDFLIPSVSLLEILEA